MSRVAFWVGKATPKLRGLKTGADKERRKIENSGIRAITSALKKQLKLAIRNEADVPNAEQRLSLGSELVYDATLNMIERAILLGVHIGRDQIDSVMGVSKILEQDWTLVNASATQWATSRAGELIRELDNTSRKVVREAVAQWTGSGDGLPVLTRNLEKVGWGFDSRRAKLIAQTETTKAYAEGNIQAWKASKIINQQEWRTANDELVCPICAPLGGLAYGTQGAEDTSPANQERRAARTSLGGSFTHPGGAGLASGLGGGTYQQPPAHPNCRCWLVPVVIEIPQEPIPEPRNKPIPALPRIPITRPSVPQRVPLTEQPTDLLARDMAGRHETIKEAEAWAEANIAEKANYKFTTVQVANEINKGIVKNVPSTVKFDVVGPTRKVARGRRPDGVVYEISSSYDARSGKQLSLKFQYGRNHNASMEALEASLDHADDTGFLMPTGSRADFIDEVFVHEHAHVIDAVDMPSKWGRHSDELETLILNSERIEGDMAQKLALIRKQAAVTGDYVNHNNAEQMAELYRAWKGDKLIKELKFIEPFMEELDSISLTYP